ncbi:hypothetical protein [Pediococcus pentosaceus]|uniref:hypothetical protein n=1 Tax=Pediococcus pentosaceus TaxID=1255 RepID=UPI0039829882
MKNMIQGFIKTFKRNFLTLLSAEMILWLVIRLIGEDVKLPMDIVAFGIACGTMLIVLSIARDDEVNSARDQKQRVKPTGITFSSTIKGDKHVR